MTTDEARRLFDRYYGGVDRGDMTAATAVLHPDVTWNHRQVWAHHAFASGAPTALEGRDAVRVFLDERSAQLRSARITHHVREIILDGDRGALIGAVEGPGPERRFIVWFELADGLVRSYLLRPV